jgi:alpha-maltose-1-phosphate synthase
MMSRYRVLLIAEAANPEWTSVPLVGWSHARALAELTDAHMVTQVRNVAAIERAGLTQGLEFTALDSERVARPLWRFTDLVRKATGLGWTFETAVQALSYYYFEHAFWQRFGAEIEAGRWDIVHRITPLSPTTPSIVATRCKQAGVPFVLGPLNGGVPWPPGFSDAQHKEGEWLHYVRDAYRLMPGYRGTLDSASAIIAGSIATRGQLPKSALARTVYLPENAIDEQRFNSSASGPVGSPLRIAFVGRLVPYKGADMLIEAAAELIRAGKVTIDIIGDGPERQPLSELADRLGVSHGVRIEGWVEHRLLAPRLLESDVFGFPSVREFGGAVVLEAMALGLVPVVADYAGPAELVTENTGFRVPMGSRSQLIAGVRSVLERLSNDPSGLREMGTRGRKRALDHYTWKAKASQVLEVYRWVRGERDKPDFGMPFPG